MQCPNNKLNIVEIVDAQFNIELGLSDDGKIKIKLWQLLELDSAMLELLVKYLCKNKDKVFECLQKRERKKTCAT